MGRRLWLAIGGSVARLVVSLQGRWFLNVRCCLSCFVGLSRGEEVMQGALLLVLDVTAVILFGAHLGKGSCLVGDAYLEKMFRFSTEYE